MKKYKCFLDETNIYTNILFNVCWKSYLPLQAVSCLVIVFVITLTLKPKKPKDKINDFILRYNIKHGIVRKKN